MLYLIGLGLSKDSISIEGLDALKKCKKIYLENYTVEFPYSKEELEKILKKKIFDADRSFVESLEIVKEAKKENVALLVYGSPLTATTHISIIQECKAKKVKCEIVYNASILDAVAETGLQSYKFGKVASMPKWAESFKPTSFVELLKENRNSGAHSLILIDIGLEFKNALKELIESADSEHFELGDILVCSRLGMSDSKMFYGSVDTLNKKAKVKAPFCIIIPGKMHFLEKEVVEGFKA